MGGANLYCVCVHGAGGHGGNFQSSIGLGNAKFSAQIVTQGIRSF